MRRRRGGGDSRPASILLLLCVFLMGCEGHLKFPVECASIEKSIGEAHVDEVATLIASLEEDGHAAQDICSGLTACKGTVVDSSKKHGSMRFQSTGAKLEEAPTNSLLCPNDCSGKGLCTAGVCMCEPGVGGADCTIDLCDLLNSCSGHGWCVGASKCLCYPGFTGVNCSKAIACDKKCSGNGVCQNGKCFCSPGFQGSSCSEKVACPKDCSGHGICHRGSCLCAAGYAMADCSLAAAVRPCPKDCGGEEKGECRNGKCYCKPGFDGEDCSTELKCPGNCNGHGVCPYGKRCLCEAGWTGEDCTTPFGCPNGCNKRGVCKAGKCFCDPGYGGADCREVKACPGDCSGRGTCIVGVCYCQPDYTGKDCSMSARESRRLERLKSCTNNCNGHGICAAGMKALNGAVLGNCLCEPGYYGAACETSKPCPQGAAGAQCSGNGLCMGGVCACREGYSGPDCGKVDYHALATGCKGNCGNHGECILGSCYCAPGWTGPSCSKTLQCSKNCSGHGRCFDGQCFCDPGYSDGECATAAACPNDCSKHGVCVSGRCLCEPGYVGLDCSQAPGCSLHPCVNGVCQGGKCLCENGFGGVNCAVPTADVAQLSSSGEPHCLNECVHGVCALIHSRLLDFPSKELHLAFSCKCERGWAGEKCDKPLFSLKHKCLPETCVHGECISGVCVCLPGYSGTFCDQGSAGSDGSSYKAGKETKEICVEMTNEEKAMWKRHLQEDTEQRTALAITRTDRKSQGGTKALLAPTKGEVVKAVMDSVDLSGLPVPLTTNSNATAKKLELAANATNVALGQELENFTAAASTSADLLKFKQVERLQTPYFKQVKAQVVPASSIPAAAAVAPKVVATEALKAAAPVAKPVPLPTKPAAVAAASCPVSCTPELGQCLQSNCVCHRGVAHAACMKGVELAAASGATMEVRGIHASLNGKPIHALAGAWTGSTVVVLASLGFAFGLFVGFGILLYSRYQKRGMALSILKAESEPLIESTE